MLLPKTYESVAVLMPLNRPDLLKTINMNALISSLGSESFAVPDDLLQYSELVNAEQIGKDECIAILRSRAMRDKSPWNRVWPVTMRSATTASRVS